MYHLSFLHSFFLLYKLYNIDSKILGYHQTVAGENYTFYIENPKSSLPSNNVAMELIKKSYSADDHKPTINQPKAGDNTITGTGVAGDKIVLTDKDGIPLGEATVGQDGKYTLTPSRPIKEGETLTAPLDTDGQTGTPVTAKVDRKPYNGTEQHNSNQPASDSLSQTGTNDSIQFSLNR